MRKIIHCDCDSFYASVEMRDDPNLRTRPIAVGGHPDKRGVVATCNYNARAYGVHSAMPMSQALRLCPELVVLPTNMKKYKAESIKVQKIFHEYTDLVEPLSLDEAFLDVSNCTLAQGSATLVGQEIRQRVRQEVGITISAGIAPNKFLAKIASDWNKPDGQLTITPAEVDAFVFELPVKKIFGVGGVTAKRMHDMGIRTCGDLQKQPLIDLTRRFGKFGARLYELSRGIDNRPVNTDRVRKSLSAERTYADDLPDLANCQQALQALVIELDERIARAGCRDLITQRTMKVRFSGFQTTTVASAGVATTLPEYQALLTRAWSREQKPVRLLGVGVKLSRRSNDAQMGLFEDAL
jgi:DNA polymerase-4